MPRPGPAGGKSYLNRDTFPVGADATGDDVSRVISTILKASLVALLCAWARVELRLAVPALQRLVSAFLG